VAPIKWSVTDSGESLHSLTISFASNDNKFPLFRVIISDTTFNAIPRINQFCSYNVPQVINKKCCFSLFISHMRIHCHMRREFNVSLLATNPTQPCHHLFDQLAPLHPHQRGIMLLLRPQYSTSANGTDDALPQS